MTALGSCKRWYSRDLAAHTTLKSRIEGQDTREEEQKKNLHEELEECERRHFSSKDDRDCRKRDHLLLEGSRRDTEDRIVCRSVDADNSDVEVKRDDKSNDDDEDEDDTLALLAELEQIRKKITEEELKKERLEREEELKVKECTRKSTAQ